MNYDDKTMCELRRNDIFRFLGSKTEYRVVMTENILVERAELPVSVICQSLSSFRKIKFDLSKKFDYKGSFCEMAFRRVQVKPKN